MKKLLTIHIYTHMHKTLRKLLYYISKKSSLFLVYIHICKYIYIYMYKYSLSNFILERQGFNSAKKTKII